MADNKDIKKSVEETVNQILSTDQSANGGTTQLVADPTAAVTKAMPASSPANGGEDKIRSGSPMSEEEKAEEAKKAQAADEEKKRKEKDEDDAKKAMADKESKEKESKEKEEKDCKSKDKMKKSLEELADHLDADELELVKTWREECEKESVAKSQAAPEAPVAGIQMEQLQEVLKKAISEQTADLKKAIDDKDTLIKGLNDKIEKMASQPAYDRRSISTLETLEKSGAQASGELTKSQVLDKMLELQAAGKGVTSHHIAEFEATRNISDPTVRGIVFRELKVNQ